MSNVHRSHMLSFVMFCWLAIKIGFILSARAFIEFVHCILAPFSFTIKSIGLFPFGYKLNTASPTDSRFPVIVPFESWPKRWIWYGYRVLPIYPLIPITLYAWCIDVGLLVIPALIISVGAIIWVIIDDFLIPFAMWADDQEWSRL